MITKSTKKRPFFTFRESPDALKKREQRPARIQDCGPFVARDDKGQGQDAVLTNLRASSYSDEISFSQRLSLSRTFWRKSCSFCVVGTRLGLVGRRRVKVVPWPS